MDTVLISCQGSKKKKKNHNVNGYKVVNDFVEEDDVCCNKVAQLSVCNISVTELVL